jgi:hypothetical protein
MLYGSVARDMFSMTHSMRRNIHCMSQSHRYTHKSGVGSIFKILKKKKKSGVNITRLSLSYWMMLIFMFFSNFYNISKRFVSIAENRQKTVKNRQTVVKTPPTAALLILTTSLSHLWTTYYIQNSKSLAYTVPEILLNYTENHQKAVKCHQPLHWS